MTVLYACTSCGWYGDSAVAIESEHKTLKAVLRLFTPGDLFTDKLCPKCKALAHQKMSNTNCLFGKRCPKCESLEPFRVRSTCMATWCDDGIFDTVDFKMTDSAYMQCLSCGHEGNAHDFHWK